MKLERVTKLDVAMSARFVWPVIGENVFTTAVGLIFSQIISTISPSALAAIGISNSIMTAINALFTVVTTGSAVLIARQIGAMDRAGAGDTVEQSLFLSVTASLVVTAVCELLSVPILRLCMPSATDEMFAEAVKYYRVLMLSLMPLVIHGMMSAVSRAVGDSKSPLRVALIMNAVQVLVGYLLIRVFHMEESGAGLSYLICRILGAGVITASVIKNRAACGISLRNALKPKIKTAKRILAIGLPCSIESIAVQIGYLLANSMSIALGAMEAGVYQILNTVNTFVTLPQAICTAVAMTTVGHLLGAKRLPDARMAGRAVWAAGIAATLMLGAIVCALGVRLSGIYSSDAAEISVSANLFWLLIVMDIAGVTCNAIDPQLRAGGDVRYVMTTAATGVWLVRLPLTYLFCFVLNWGVTGLFAANSISLYFRACAALLRLRGEKWYIRKV